MAPQQARTARRANGLLLKLVAAAGLVAGVSLTHCWAFSPGRGFLQLSNYELVKTADDIVVAEAIGTHPLRENMVRFRIARSLKGAYPHDEVVTFGYTDPKQYRGPSARGDFSRARPGAYAGEGMALDYGLGKKYLLFLTKSPLTSRPRGRTSLAHYASQIDGDHIWRVGVRSLSRDREEIVGTQDPWVRTVEIYARLARLADYRHEKEQLRRLGRLAREDRSCGRHPRGLAADIERHFETVSPLKSYEDLKAFHDAATTDRARDAVLCAMAQAAHPAAFGLLRDAASTDEYFTSYFLAVNHPGRVNALFELFPTLTSEDRKRNVLRSLTRDAGGGEGQGDRGRLIGLVKHVDASGQAGAILSKWIYEHRTPESLRILRDWVDREYDRSWRTSVYLAHLGDEDIVEWAKRSLQSDRYIRPVYVLAFSPTAEARHAAEELIASGEERRISALRHALESRENRSPHREWLLGLLPAE